MVSLPEPLTSAIDSGLEWVYGLEEVFAPTVCLVPSFVEGAVQSLADSIGFDYPTLSYVLGMFVCYPLGLILVCLPYGPIRHLFSFLLGAFLLQLTIGVQWMHQLITSLICYGMFLVLPRSKVSTYVPVFVMLYMTAGHLHRQYVNYLGWDLDFTGAQMVLTQKLYMMAYNLSDGHANATGKSTKASDKCSKFALEKVPNLMEFLGYTFNFSNILAGPAYEFSVYNRACTGSLFYQEDGKTPKGTIPSNVLPTLIPFGKCLVCLGAFVVVGGMFPLLDPNDPQNNLPTIIQPEFLETKPWLYRYAFMWVALLAVRQKYYFAWNNAEGANNIWYAGFDGFDDDSGKALGWEQSSNIDIIQFETAPNTQTLSRYWNKKTSLWLNRYVYIRTNGSLIAVYSLSAFWHGFYPGYYLFFLSIPLMTSCERLGRKKISPYFSDQKWSLYGLACIFCTSLCIEYFVSAFTVLAFDRAWAIWKSHYFFGHIVCVVFYVVVSQLPTPKPKAKAE